MSRIPVLLAAAVLASGCAGGLFSGTGPADHARALRDLHDPKTFRHLRDSYETRESCVEEIRALAAADYDSWPEAGIATWVLIRAAKEDPTVVGRNEAVHALGAVGSMFAGAEVPAEPAGSVDYAEAFRRLGELHEGPKGLHPSEAAAAECLALVDAVGGLRVPLPEDGNAVGLHERRRALSEALVRVLGIERSEESHADPAARAGIDRALVALAGQAARTTLVEAAIHDPDERVRFTAAGIVAAYPGEGIARSLVTAFRAERIASVRRVIVQGLGARAAEGPGADRDAAVPVLVAALDDDDRGVRFHGRESLRTLAGEDLGDRPEPWIQWWTSQAAGR